MVFEVFREIFAVINPKNISDKYAKNPVLFYYKISILPILITFILWFGVTILPYLSEPGSFNYGYMDLPFLNIPITYWLGLLILLAFFYWVIIPCGLAVLFVLNTIVGKVLTKEFKRPYSYTLLSVVYETM